MTFVIQATFLSALIVLQVDVLQKYSRGQSSTTEWWLGPVHKQDTVALPLSFSRT